MTDEAEALREKVAVALSAKLNRAFALYDAWRAAEGDSAMDASERVYEELYDGETLDALFRLARQGNRASPAPVPAGAGERLLNLTKALLDDANQEVADLQALLTKASEEVCSNQCRSYFPAGHVRSDADHSELCHAIRAALNPPAERPAPPSGGMTEGARTRDASLLSASEIVARERAQWEDCSEGQIACDNILAAISFASPPAPASGTTEEVERLQAKLKEAHGTIDQLRGIRPQAFILSRASEWSRLFREVHGYLRTCHGKHGTDWDGRQHAMNALEAARKELEAAAPPSLQTAREDGE